MQNCRVSLLRLTDTLAAGHRQAGQEQTLELWSGPGYLSAPTREWERQAALEQAISGTLIVHTTVNLSSITQAIISNHAQAGTYEVLGVSSSGMGWTLTLGKKAAHAAA